MKSRKKGLIIAAICLSVASPVFGEEKEVDLDCPKEYTDYSNTEVAELLKSATDGMVSVYPTEYDDGRQYCYFEEEQEETVLRNFSIVVPSAQKNEVENAIWDPSYIAEKTVYCQYEFLFDYMKYYSDVQPIDMRKFDLLQADEWIALKGLDTEKGYASDKDGGYYYWMPVYYPDADGSLYDDTLYLFCYTIWEGKNEEFLNDHPKVTVFDDYRAEMTILADQEKVAKILTAMLEGKSETQSQEEYPELSEGSSGEYVEKLQKELWDMGYQMSSVDGQFGSYTKEAVSAYQLDHNLEVTGIADAMLQKELYEKKEEQQLLEHWLEAYED